MELSSGFGEKWQKRTYNLSDTGILDRNDKDKFVEIKLGKNPFNRGDIEDKYNNRVTDSIKQKTELKDGRDNFNANLDISIQRAKDLLSSVKVTVEKMGALPPIKEPKGSSNKSLRK